MYLSESSGFFGTHGLASTPQSSCHRLNMIAGRLHAFAEESLPVVVCAAAFDTTSAVGSAVPSALESLALAVSEAAKPALSASAWNIRPRARRPLSCLVRPNCSALVVVNFGDIAAGEFEHGRLSRRARVRGDQHLGAGGPCLVERLSQVIHGVARC